jgi:hypothetical protein
LGLTDEVSEGNFVWDSGEPVTFTQWAPGQPDNYLGDEDYCEMVMHPGHPSTWFGMWNDRADVAGAVHSAIIEIPAVPSPSTPSCGISPPPGSIVNPANGHAYLLTTTAMNFNAARALAASMGGHLVTITSSAEQAFVVANFSVNYSFTYGFGVQAAWMGLSDEITEGTFLWDTGETSSYKNWYIGQPDNYGGNQDAGRIYLLQGLLFQYGCWDDQFASSSEYALIEFPLVQNQPPYDLKLFGSSGPGAANLKLWAGGVPCGQFSGATLVSLTPAPAGPGTGAVFGINADSITVTLLYTTQPQPAPNVQPWSFYTGFAGSGSAYPYTPWTAPWGSTAVLPSGTIADLVLLVVPPTGVVASNVVRFVF